jgi:hypothetical protein
MERRDERVMVETARHRIVGTLSLPRYRNRFSDFLNTSEREFIALTDVTVEPLDADGRAGEATTRDFIAISRRHIVMATTAPTRD